MLLRELYKSASDAFHTTKKKLIIMILVLSWLLVLDRTYKLYTPSKSILFVFVYYYLTQKVSNSVLVQLNLSYHH